MKILFRLGTAALIAAVIFATLGPARYRPHSQLGQDGEHALAFVLVGLAVGLSFPQRRLRVAAIAIVLIGILEIMQRWAPGRHARLEDFLVDAAAACLGLVGAAAIGWLAARLHGSRSR
ncbi:VanZ family protein [Nitrobacter winogradskyi]|uniref:VanZ family protein n=1 Tax=Nitrobacter winogradskyi TaxID=913 RepID=A0ACC6AFU8_NITWI|nr:VanZ family protein [Nitrobacter winogradskyi]MCP1998718.1 VanZ family protein [Nitrobacter winogradskyi]